MKQRWVSLGNEIDDLEGVSPEAQATIENRYK